jgi:tetratricopeptide (TPR) repeat protein
MIGDVVNLSARLMQAACGGILCDEATHRAARSRLHFDALPPISVKGKTGLVPVYRPDGSAERAADAEAQELAGRKPEREALAERLRVRTSAERDARSAERTDSVRIPAPAVIGPVVFIEGEAGIGKSRLVADLLWEARGTGLTVLSGSGDAVEKSTPYYAWRAVFQQLFHLDGVPDEADAIRQHIANQLEGKPQLLGMAPLLSVAVKGDWPDNDFTAQMTGETRADNTNRLLAHLLNEASATAPLLLVLEDCQWLDSPSWALARLVVREVNPVLLVLTARPLGDSAPSDLVHLREKPGTMNLRLEMLSSSETADLMRQRLGVRSIPSEVTALVHEKAQGNPLFIEELTHALREAHLIGVFGEECRLTAGPERLRSFNVPDTVQGVVTSRVDRLTPPQQLALKVASVIGRVFPFRLLSEIYPIECDRASLAGLLQDLVRLELVRKEASEPELVYAFKNVITREVVYELMLESQRRQLHQEVAGWYERVHASDLTPFYPLLAHHWARAEFAGRAIACLEKAGELALHSYANDEAIGFFSEALLLAERQTGRQGDAAASSLSVSLSDGRKASWQRQLGEAYYALGNMGKSLGHFQAALTLLGLSVPRSRWRLAMQMLRELARQLLHRAWPWLFLGRRRRVRETLLEAARAYERLAQIHYLDDAKLACLHSAFRTLNLAESAGTSPELARAYANASVLFGLLSMHGTARAHAERARKTADEVNLVPCSTYVFEVVGVYWYGVGDWTRAKETLGEARALAERIGDMRRWDEILFPWSMVPAHQGDFARGGELASQMYESAKRRGIVQVQSWGLSWELACLLPLDQRSREVSCRVEELMHTLESLLAEHSVKSGALVRADEVLAHGLLAKARWRRSEVDLALRSADAAARAGAGSEPTSHYVLAGYAGMAEVYLGLWESGRGDAVLAEEMAGKVYPVCKTLHTFAKMHPVGHPLAWLYQGLAHWLAGKARKARRCWSESLAAAERLAMPYEQGLAHYELGRWAEYSDPQRREHLSRAAELFQQTAAKHDLTLAEKALGAQG